MQETKLNENIQVKLSEILLSFGRAISITLGMGVFHTLQTAKIAYLIAHNLKLNKNQKQRLVFSALLHDIGASNIKKNFLLCLFVRLLIRYTQDLTTNNYQLGFET